MTNKYYLDAGTTYSKIIEVTDTQNLSTHVMLNSFQHLISERPCDPAHPTDGGNGNSGRRKTYYIIPSKLLKTIDIKFEKSCGHMGAQKSAGMGEQETENEIIALANGCKNIVSDNATVLDLGSRDAKWIRFKDAKFKDMDWNTSCASSTGATVEMLLKFYEVDAKELSFTSEKFPVTCGIFGLEKIMDDISKGANHSDAISKFIHGIAYNAWSFAKKPQKIYLSGGFCENKCFVDSLKSYCDVELLGRFVLCEGLIE